MSENAYLTHYQKNRDVILNRAKDYYQNDKERLTEYARDKYRNLHEEQKNFIFVFIYLSSEVALLSKSMPINLLIFFHIFL